MADDCAHTANKGGCNGVMLPLKTAQTSWPLCAVENHEIVTGDITVRSPADSNNRRFHNGVRRERLDRNVVVLRFAVGRNF